MFINGLLASSLYSHFLPDQDNWVFIILWVSAHRKPLVAPARSEGSSGLPPFPRSPPPSSSHPAWALSHPGPDHCGLSPSGDGSVPSYSGLGDPREPLGFWCVLIIAQTRDNPGEMLCGKFLLKEQIERLASPRRFPRLFSRIAWMLRVPTPTHLTSSALVPHDTHPHLSLPQLWPPRGPLSCVRPSSPTCYREQVRGQGHHPCHITCPSALRLPH